MAVDGVEKIAPPRVPSPRTYLTKLWFRFFGILGLVIQLVTYLVGTLQDIFMLLLVSPIYTCFWAPQTHLESPVVVITGASSGIGYEFAKFYARERKASLVLAARRMERLEALAKECRKLGAVMASAVKYDASTKNSGVGLAEAVRNLGYEHVDVLFLNAGINADIGKIEYSKDTSDVDWVMDVNFRGYIRAAHAFIPFLKKSRKPQLAVNSSIGAYLDIPYYATYIASKSAVSSFFDCFAHQMTKHGIQVANIHFGFIDTELAGKGTIHTLTSGRKMDLNDDPILAQRPMPNPLGADAAVKETIRWLDAGHTKIFVPNSSNRFLIWMLRNGYMDLNKRGKATAERLDELCEEKDLAEAGQETRPML